MPEKHQDRINGNIDRQQQEERAYDTQSYGLGALALPLGGFIGPAKTPEQGYGRAIFDHGVHAETDQRDAAGQQSGSERNHGFK